MKSGTIGGTAVHAFQRNDRRNAERRFASTGAGVPRNGKRNDDPVFPLERSTHSLKSGTVERVSEVWNGWESMLRQLTGDPLPKLPGLPGRVHRVHDEPLSAADLADVHCPKEFARLLGITKAAAIQRLQTRKEAHHD